MNGVREWVLGLIAAAAVLAVLEAIIPKTAAGAIAQTGGGLVLLLVFLHPVLSLSPQQITWIYEDYLQQIDSQIEEYRSTETEQLENIIQAETGAYISEKAAQMGIDCHVRVRTVLRDGIPYPDEVAMSAEKNEELAGWLAEELDIPYDRQHWGVKG